MIIEKKNQSALHNVLIKDLQARLWKQHELYIKTHNITDNDFDSQLSMLVDSVLHTDTLADVNDIVIEYNDLFEMTNMELPYVCKHSVCSLDGTMNYMFVLLASSDKLSTQPNHEYYS